MGEQNTDVPQVKRRGGAATRWCGAGVCHMRNVLWGYATDPQFDRKEAVRLLRLALSLDDSDADTLAWASMISAYIVGDCESSVELERPMVPRGGIEPPTLRFSVACSTN